MTIGITGPGRKAPRQNAVVGLIIAAFVGGICLILLGLASDFLVDWLWFSSIGYLPIVFDQHRRQSLGVFRRLDGNGCHTLAERITCCAFCPAAADPSGRRLRVEPDGQYVAA
jgi:hypothetical protein